MKFTISHRLGMALPLVITFAMVFTPAPAPAQAEPDAPNAHIFVTTSRDELNADGDCSLREAVAAANNNAAVDACAAGSGSLDTVNIPAGTYTLTLPGGLRLTSNIMLKGAGAATTIIDGGGAGQGRTLLSVSYQELFVCDTTNDRVLRYRESGAYAGTFISSGSGGLDNPGAIIPARSNSLSQYVYVSGYTSGIKRYNSVTGAYVDTLSIAGAPSIFGPTDIAFGKGFNFDLFATNYVLNEGGVWRFNPSTGFQSVFASTPYLPSSIVFGTSDDLFATDPTNHRVLRYNGNDGALVGTFASSQLNQPRGLVFGRDGHLYVANENSNNIIKFNGQSGAFMETFVSAGAGGLDKPTDLTFGPDGNLYVISRGTASVLRFDGATGDFIDVFVAAGEGGIGTPSCLQWMDGVGTGPNVLVNGLTLQRGIGGIYVAERSSLEADHVVIQNNSGGFGGGIGNAGTAKVSHTLIQNNNSFNFGGGIQNIGVLDVNYSTLTENFAPNNGGGIMNNGASAIMRVNNTTVSGNNTNRAGGGIFNGAGAQAALNNVTIAFNNADSNDSAGDYGGGGVWNDGASSVFSMRNTIIAKNTDFPVGIAGEAPDCGGETFISRQRNLIGNNKGCSINDPDSAGLPLDQVGTAATPIDPRLNALAMNGGATPTHALQSNSPAVNQGATFTNDAEAFHACRTRDQRGFVRPAGGRCDVGAYEFEGLPPPVMVLPVLLK